MVRYNQCGMCKTRLFRKGTYLAVLAEDSGFWICWTKGDVFLENDNLSIAWLEKFEGSNLMGHYERMEEKVKIDLRSVITKVTMIREKDESSGKSVYRLPEKEKIKVEQMLTKLKHGFRLNAYEKEISTEKTSDVLLMEVEGEVNRKRKHPGEEKKKIKTNQKERKAHTKNKKQKAPKEKKSRTSKKPKEKKKVDRTDPNRRLKPNIDVSVWTKDPLFEMKEKVPFVSSFAHSKLVIRAVLTNDMKLLEQCKQNVKEINSLFAKRSLGNEMTALRYALKNQNLAAIKILCDSSPKIRIGLPTCLLATHGTGTYNYRTLGIKKVRRLNMSRGAREGNNAFTKDQQADLLGDSQISEADIMRWNLPKKFIKDLDSIDENISKRLIDHAFEAVRYGNRELAAYIIEKDVNQGGSSFSKFYKDALLEKTDPWDGTVREVSARKKAGYENKQITPLHCACINPSTGVVEALFKVCPDLYIADSDEKKLVHYAAACEDDGPLKFLFEKGANLEDPDKDGQTPLMIACKVGRDKCANFIIEKLAERTSDEYSLKKFGKGGIDKPGKDTWCSLHTAVAHQNHNVVKILLKHGAKLDKPLGAAYDKITPLMLAAANGDLEMIKILINKKAKIEKPDKHKRTALTHAVINGSANVASYLLSLGVDSNKLDSSQNSNLHYACAYGWWFCMKVLIDAGAVVDAKNEWSLTPLGVAIMKGNKGIVDHLVNLPGIDINMKDDKGRTILLNMLVNQNEFTDELFNDIKKLVETCGADPKVKDHEGKTALHLLASSTIKQSHPESELKIVQSICNYFIGRGLSALDVDVDGNLPLVYAFWNKYTCSEYDDYKTGNVQIMEIFLRNMESHWKEIDILTAEKLIYKLMSEFVNNISLLRVSDYLNIYHKIGEFIAVLKNNGVLKDTGFIDEICKEPDVSVTIFSRLCRHYSTQKFRDSWRENVPVDVQQKCWEVFVRLMQLFIIDYKPEFNVNYIPEDKTQKPKILRALTWFSKVSQDSYLAFKMILKYSTDVNVVDSNEQTALMIMIEKNEMEHVKSLLHAGAKINQLRKTKDGFKELPIERAMKNKNMEMLRFLISNGAIVDTQPLTGSSLLHTSVEICAANKSKYNLEFVKLFLENGCNVNEKSSSGNTPLHVAVNKSRDDPDVSLDLEILLLRNGADVHALDHLFRTPLFYAFVKEGDCRNTSACDPIQIVSSLVECMDVKKIQEKDTLGASVLHYAALRGATVCSLLLIQKGSDINSLDILGNSPLANAVIGKHDSCALTLIQKDADINVQIHKADNHMEYQEGTKNQLWKYLPQHWPQAAVETTPISLFEGIVTNDWLGITYVVLGKMEQFGMSFAKAIEVALHLQKLQFAKTLLSKQVDESKLKGIVTDGRNLINCLAYEVTNRNSELINDVYALLDSAGVEADQIDKFGSSPLHYAALKNDHIVASLLINNENVKEKINKVDDLGRTPLATFFWNYDRIKPSTIEHIPTLLLQNGADPNVVFNSKPLSILDEGYHPRFLESQYNNPKVVDSPLYVSPLIIAIVHRDLKMVRLLLKNGANVTVSDSIGRTPAMYAMKTNNQAIIDEILSHQMEKNMDCLDNLDYGMIDHALTLEPMDVESPTYDNAETITKILKTDINLSGLSKNGRNSPLIRAKLVAANESGKALSTSLEKKFKETYNFPPDIKGKELKMFHDHRLDSKMLMKNKEEELQKTFEGEYNEECQEGCIVGDGNIYKDYDILMHKVDVGFGAFGLYNFYRIQIWKEEHKELYVLFTNWGRIDRYSQGQYQNTPFSTPEEAIKEFSKIFKAKSGNEWDERDTFVNKPKKYRLVPMEHRSRCVRPSFEMDLLTHIKSTLPISTQCFLKDITDVNMLKEAYKAEAKIDTSCVPFERIKEESIVQANKLLDELLPIVKQREELDSQKYKVEGEEQEKVLQELNDVLDGVCKLSSEYYFLVPKEGYEYEKVSPIDNTSLLEEEKKRLQYLLEFETSKSIILGAMLRKQEMHPFDYIFSSLKCKIEMMSEDCQEAQYIMKYMYRSNGAQNKRVEGIFRVQREEETERFSQDTRPNNRKLLWHGTKLENMMSILSKGLILNAPYARVTGRSFGDGIYFADIFDKSSNYASTQYMLLCDVNLGKCHVVEDTLVHETNIGEFVNSHQYDSLYVRGQNIPDEMMTLKTKEGFFMPLGKIIPKTNAGGSGWRSQTYSEYIVYQPESIVIRYIVKIGNGQKKYSKQDLFLKEQEPMEVDGLCN